MMMMIDGCGNKFYDWNDFSVSGLSKVKTSRLLNGDMINIFEIIFFGMSPLSASSTLHVFNEWADWAVGVVHKSEEDAQKWRICYVFIHDIILPSNASAEKFFLWLHVIEYYLLSIVELLGTLPWFASLKIQVLNYVSCPMIVFSFLPHFLSLH